MEQLPIFVNLQDKPCLIVGGGAVAARKARLLLRAGAAITVIAPSISGEMKALGSDRLTFVEAAFRPDACEGQQLVIAATSDDSVNRSVSAAAAHYRAWCNVVDNLSLSTFIFPAIVDRSPVVVAVGTSGTAPVLARRIKKQIETHLPARIGELAARAGKWRHRVKHRFPEMRERLRFWERFFDGAIAQHLLAGRRREAERAFGKALLRPVGDRQAESGEAYIVGAGPGDPALMTLRGRQLLGQADVVLYDALVPVEILDYARKDATLKSVGKKPGESNKQADINRLLIDLVTEGLRVCRLKGGDPFVFGRGGEEAQALRASGLPYQVVPGISAALGCAASAGIPLTHRGVSSSVTFATAVVDRSVDTSNGPDWASLSRPGQTLALYMSVRSLADVSAKLMDHGLDSATPAAVVENGTTPIERVIQADLGSIARISAAYRVRSPAILYVGNSVGLRAQPDRTTRKQAPDAVIGSARIRHGRPASAARISINTVGEAASELEASATTAVFQRP